MTRKFIIHSFKIRGISLVRSFRTGRVHLYKSNRWIWVYNSYAEAYRFIKCY